MKRPGVALIIIADVTVADMVREVVVEQSDLWPVVTPTIEEALTFLRGEERLPDLVIVDNELAGDSYENLRRLREYRKTRQNTPIPLLISNKALLVLIANRWLQVLERPVSYARLSVILRGDRKPRRRREKKPGRQD